MEIKTHGDEHANKDFSPRALTQIFPQPLLVVVCFFSTAAHAAPRQALQWSPITVAFTPPVTRMDIEIEMLTKICMMETKM